MKFLKSVLVILFLSVTVQSAHTQSNRITMHENIGWYNTFLTVKLPKNFGFHGEYQWRRVELGDEWQQSLLRIGMNYNWKPNVQMRIGYAWVETFVYGEHAINVFGKNFTEHRAFQMLQYSQQEGRLQIQHRYMLEQRFVGKYDNPTREREDAYVYSNRMRYMLRLQMPFKGAEIQNKSAYWAVYNELFIGFGKNVNANVFDQNRFGLLLGYRFNDVFRIEAGYLNQILQFGRQIDGKNVFQYNSGLIVNTFISF
jgi:hypothetical protein